MIFRIIITVGSYYNYRFYNQVEEAMNRVKPPLSPSHTHTHLLYGIRHISRMLQRNEGL